VFRARQIYGINEKPKAEPNLSLGFFCFGFDFNSQELWFSALDLAFGSDPNEQLLDNSYTNKSMEHNKHRTARDIMQSKCPTTQQRPRYSSTYLVLGVGIQKHRLVNFYYCTFRLGWCAKRT
jgi:hypothetical protein